MFSKSCVRLMRRLTTEFSYAAASTVTANRKSLSRTGGRSGVRAAPGERIRFAAIEMKAERQPHLPFDCF